MSRHTAKTSRRTAKTTGRTVKKATKTARAVKKTAKTGRRPVGKATRKSPSIAPQTTTAAMASAPAITQTASPPVQPAGALEAAPIRGHKYRVGETVYFTSPTFGRAAATGIYTVVKLLPSESDDYQYRIKSSGEAFERVAKESQLERA
jgi:hypothetical protein